MQRLLSTLRSNWITAAGSAIATLSLMALITTLVYVSLHGGAHGAYLGLFAFLLIPIVFVIGLLLIPAGLLIYRGQYDERMARLAAKPMRLLPVLGVLLVVNLATMGTAGYEATRYMDSPQFCGTVCHPVMEPAYVSSLDAPHANVACVKCHIGPGIGSFIEAKLNGIRQLSAAVFDDYSKPIPTPVHTVRPAREICESCHWPGKEKYNRLVVRQRFGDDAAVTPKFSVMVMKIGEKDDNGVERGIHWHANSDVDISYISSDGRRTIDWVRYVNGDGVERIFGLDGEHLDSQPEGVLRRMDCIDCHNQPGHFQQDPMTAVDEAIAADRISRRLPSIRKLAIETLQKPWDRDTVRTEIRRGLDEAYGASGELDAEQQELLATAANAIADIWLRNVFPEMNVTWGTYPNFIGHEGCMRCHGGLHEDAEGEIISFDCAICHTVLAEDEDNPKILEQLGVRVR